MRAVGGKIGKTLRVPFQPGLDGHVDQGVEAAVEDRMDRDRPLAEKEGSLAKATEIASRSAQPMA